MCLRGSERTPRSEERPCANPLFTSSVKSSGSLIPVPGAVCLGLVSVVRGLLPQRDPEAVALCIRRHLDLPWLCRAVLVGDISQKRLEVAVVVSWEGASGRRRLVGLPRVVRPSVQVPEVSQRAAWCPHEPLALAGFAGG